MLFKNIKKDYKKNLLVRKNFNTDSYIFIIKNNTLIIKNKKKFISVKFNYLSKKVPQRKLEELKEYEYFLKFNYENRYFYYLDKISLKFKNSKLFNENNNITSFKKYPNFDIVQFNDKFYHFYYLKKKIYLTDIGKSTITEVAEFYNYLRLKIHDWHYLFYDVKTLNNITISEENYHKIIKIENLDNLYKFYYSNNHIKLFYFINNKFILCNLNNKKFENIIEIVNYNTIYRIKLNNKKYKFYNKYNLKQINNLKNLKIKTFEENEYYFKIETKDDLTFLYSKNFNLIKKFKDKETDFYVFKKSKNYIIISFKNIFSDKFFIFDIINEKILVDNINVIDEFDNYFIIKDNISFQFYDKINFNKLTWENINNNDKIINYFIYVQEEEENKEKNHWEIILISNNKYLIYKNLKLWEWKILKNDGVINKIFIYSKFLILYINNEHYLFLDKNFELILNEKIIEIISIEIYIILKNNKNEILIYNLNWKLIEKNEENCIKFNKIFNNYEIMISKKLINFKKIEFSLDNIKINEIFFNYYFLRSNNFLLNKDIEKNRKNQNKKFDLKLNEIKSVYDNNFQINLFNNKDKKEDSKEKEKKSETYKEIGQYNLFGNQINKSILFNENNKWDNPNNIGFIKKIDN